MVNIPTWSKLIRSHHKRGVVSVHALNPLSNIPTNHELTPELALCLVSARENQFILQVSFVRLSFQDSGLTSVQIWNLALKLLLLVFVFKVAQGLVRA